MKRPKLSFLYLLLSAMLVVSCVDKSAETQEDMVSGNYIVSLYKQANELRDSLPKQALHYNQRALKLIRNNTDTLHVKLIKQRLGLLRKQKPNDSLIVYAEKLLNVQRQRKDSVGISDAFRRLGFYHRLNNNIDGSLENYYHAIEYNPSKDSIQEGAILWNLSNLLNSTGNYKEAETTAVEALKYLESTSKKQNVAGLYNAIAISTKRQGLYEEALYWYDKGYEVARDSSHRNMINNNKAVVYIEQGKYGKAHAILSSLLDDKSLNKEKYLKSKARVLDNLGWAKSLLKQPKAEQDMLEALEIRKGINNTSDLNASYEHLAKHYIANNDPRANNTAFLAYEMAKETGNTDDILDALELLIETSPKPREYAIQHIRLGDSINNVRNRTANNFAKIKYDSEKNRAENERLKKETRIQELEITKAKNNILILFMGIVILLGGAMLLLRYRRIRYQKKILEETYNTETRISKKIHDELANDVFNVMSYTESKKITAAEKGHILDMLNAIYKKTRNISKDNSKIDTGSAYAEKLKTLLSGYSSEQTKIVIKSLTNITWASIDENKKRTIYRVLQELMVNMKKHSQATFVAVSFQKEHKYLSITYSDNGIGVDKKAGFVKNGLANTENRIEAVNGSIIFETALNQGFKANINIPV